jgi:hypothetical protein
LDGYWLWHVGERWTPDQVRHEIAEITVMDYETAIAGGTDPGTAADFVGSAGADAGPVRSDQHPAGVQSLGENLAEAFRATTLDQVLTRMANGPFATCGKCRNTYVVDIAVMQYATGQAIDRQMSRPVKVLPGRVVLAGTRADLEGEQAYGLMKPWQLTRATLSPDTE